MQSNLHNSARFFLLLGTILSFLTFSLVKPATLNSANLTSVSNTLQTARLSVSARVDSTGTTTGGSIVKLKTAGTAEYYTISTANLHAQDAITIDAASYTVVSIIDADEFTVTPVLDASDVDDNDPILLAQKPQHVLSFDTASAVADGYFRVLIAGSANTTAPDDQGFSYGGGSTNSVDVIATDVGNYDFVTGISTESGGTDCTSPANYHCFEAHYSGAGGIGTTIAFTIGNTGGGNSLVAPAPTSSHTEATADSFTFIVRNYDSSDSLVDETTGKIALIEAVRVTATVDPTIAFTIAGVGTGTSTCGANPDIDTAAGTNAPLAVPFGTLSLTTFKDASQNLTVSTNAAGGGVVTAIEDDQLGKDGATTPFIIDATGDGAMTHTTEDDWTTAASQFGFAYALDDTDDTDVTEAFSYDSSSTGSCTGGTFCARQFPSVADGGESPAEIFNTGGTVANAVDAFVCYRINVGATQEAGDYENQITYTATGTF